MAAEKPNPLSHVQDHESFEIFETAGLEIPLPFGLTKYMVLEVMVGALMLALFIPLARRIRRGEVPRGPLWNMLEFFLVFIRNDVAKANIGEQDADRYVPLLWTLFLFIVLCNLFGLVPFLGSPTGHIMVTGVLAAFAAVAMLIGPVVKRGPKFVLDLVPHVEVDNVLLKIFIFLFIMPLLFVIEFSQIITRPLILAIRLFANVFAGHLLLAALLGFVQIFWEKGALVAGGVTALSVTATTAVYFLEIGVALLQAYIFTFLTSLFIGLMLHPEH